MPFPIAGDLPDPGIESTSLALAGRLFTTEPLGKHTGLGNSFRLFSAHSALVQLVMLCFPSLTLFQLSPCRSSWVTRSTGIGV